MKLLKPDEKLRRFTSSSYICHNKAMTALVNTEPGVCIRFIGVRGGVGCRHPRFEKFRGNSVFHGKHKLLKNP